MPVRYTVPDGIPVVNPVVLVFALVLELAGCTGDVEGVFKTKLDHEKSLTATLDALRAIGFSVKTRNTEVGVLSAEKFDMVRWNGPALVHIHVKLHEIEAGTELRVQVIPPSGAYGSSRVPFENFAYSLNNHIPDIAVVSAGGG